MSKMKLCVLCCHYTNEAMPEELADIPAKIHIKRFPCSGRIEVVDILRAFEDDAEGVLVAGCERNFCHNRTGSLRAAKRVEAARELLKEIGFNPQVVQMAFVPRLDTGAFIEEVKKLFEIILKTKS
ncbi:hydrogenase iron-sulfur subunit [Thermodesulfatator atlanticus]